MSKWLLYAPFSKHSFWGELTDQLNRTNDTFVFPSTGIEYYLDIDEQRHDTPKPGVRIMHWNKLDSQFVIDFDTETNELIVVKPLGASGDQSFKRNIDTNKLKTHLEKYDWVAFGYISQSSPVDRYTAMQQSVYYSRDKDSNFVFLDNGAVVTDNIKSSIQTWFMACKVTDSMYVIFCHPDVLSPTFNVEYQRDCNGDDYYVYRYEEFDFFEIALRPNTPNAKNIKDTIFTTDAFITMDWSKGSFLYNKTAMALATIIAPTEIITDIPYELTDNGIQLANQRGIVTLKYKMSGLLNPSLAVNELGTITHDYLILGK
jgi:hypothetical protein